MKPRPSRSADASRLPAAICRRLSFERCEDRLLLAALPLPQLMTLSDGSSHLLPSAEHRAAEIQSHPGQYSVQSAVIQVTTRLPGEGGFAGPALLDSIPDTSIPDTYDRTDSTQKSADDEIGRGPSQMRPPSGGDTGAPIFFKLPPKVTITTDTEIRAFTSAEMPGDGKQQAASASAEVDDIAVNHGFPAAEPGEGQFASLVSMPHAASHVSQAASGPMEPRAAVVSGVKANRLSETPQLAARTLPEMTVDVAVPVDASQPVAIAFDVGVWLPENTSQPAAGSSLPAASVDAVYEQHEAASSPATELREVANEVPARVVAAEQELEDPEKLASERRQHLCTASILIIAAGRTLARDDWQQLQPRRRP